jgi:uncharacterized protein YhfF
MISQVPPQYRTKMRWSFGESDDAATALAKKVIAGVKTATCSPYEEGERLPVVGEIYVIVDGQGTPVCAVSIVDVQVTPFNQVPASHARAEAEGDYSLAYWKKLQQAVLEKDEIYDPELPLVLIKFTLLDIF